MIAKTLAYYLDLPQVDVLRLLQLPTHDLYQHPVYADLLGSLDYDLLFDTLPFAKTVLQSGLPPMVARLSAEYNLYHFPLNGHMLSDWITDFLQFPAEVWRLRDVHAGIGLHLIHEAIQEVLGMLDALGEASRLWQRAIAVMVIPLAANPITQTA